MRVTTHAGNSTSHDSTRGPTSSNGRPPVWKVRVAKRYPEAHNHLLIGEVLATDSTCVEIRCQSFHFGRLVNSIKDVRTGELGIRIIPWSHIEIINVLPVEFDFSQARLMIDAESNIVLKDRVYGCPIVTNREPSR